MSPCARCQPCPFATTQTLAALPDQDSFYDVTDCLEQQGMERVVQQYLSSKGTDLDLKQQFVLYEVSGVPRVTAVWRVPLGLTAHSHPTAERTAAGGWRGGAASRRAQGAQEDR